MATEAPETFETPLLGSISALTRLVSRTSLAEEQIHAEARNIVARLVASDTWLPEAFAKPHPQFYQQYLLYGDPLDRFSLVSFVWGPGQKTPVHDHTVWGVVGQLRGAEFAQNFRFDGQGRLVEDGTPARLEPGQTTLVSPRIGDIHWVSNAFDDRVSISIHLYGGNIGRIHRHVFDTATGLKKPFVSGYSSAVVPNLWSGAGAAPALGGTRS